MNGYELAEEVYNNIGLDENHEISNEDVIRIISFFGYNESSYRNSTIGFVCHCAREKIQKAFEEAIVYGDFKRFDELMVSINNYRNKQSESSETTNEEAIEALSAEPCEMSAEEYRQRMIQAFHNADTDELIAVCVLPTEKEFEHLEWLLKTHYKKEPCEDAISRDELLKAIDTWDKFGCDADTKLVPYQDHYIPYIHYDDVVKCIKGMSSVNPQPETGRWIAVENEEMETVGYYCSECDLPMETEQRTNFCPNCGRRMLERSE